MLKVIAAIAALVVMSETAAAACRPGTNYSCIQMPNGKMACACR